MEELRVQYLVHKGVSSKVRQSNGRALDRDGVRGLAGHSAAELRAHGDRWLHEHAGLDRRDAYALCSMAVSFRVTQWADQTGSVYSAIPQDDPRDHPQSGARGASAARIETSMRPPT